MIPGEISITQESRRVCRLGYLYLRSCLRRVPQVALRPANLSGMRFAYISLCVAVHHSRVCGRFTVPLKALEGGWHVRVISFSNALRDRSAGTSTWWTMAMISCEPRHLHSQNPVSFVHHVLVTGLPIGHIYEGGKAIVISTTF